MSTVYSHSGDTSTEGGVSLYVYTLPDFTTVDDDGSRWVGTLSGYLSLSTESTTLV